MNETAGLVLPELEALQYNTRKSYTSLRMFHMCINSKQVKFVGYNLKDSHCQRACRCQCINDISFRMYIYDLRVLSYKISHV